MSSTGEQVVSNHTTGPTLMKFAIAFMILEVLFVGLWYIATYLRNRPISFDNFFMPLALVFNIGLGVIGTVMVNQAYAGHHQSWVLENHPAGLIAYRKIQVPFPMIYALACTFPKLAILGLYLRIFVEPRDRIATYTLMAIITSWSLSIIILSAVQCVPLAYLWNPTAYPGGHCVDINSFWKWSTVPNTLTDVVMLLLPFPCIRKLRLPLRDKIGVALTFCTGSIGLITSIARFAIFIEVIDKGKQVDYTFTTVRLSCFAIVEAGVYLMAACLPSYRSLFRTIREHATGRTRTNGHTSAEESISLNARHTKVFRHDNGFSRLDNEGRALTSIENLVESNAKIESSKEPELGGNQVKQDYAVSSFNV